MKDGRVHEPGEEVAGIHRFSSHEQAALFVAKQRSEGRFARILDDALGNMWGGAVIGGVRVIVGEKAEDPSSS